MDLVLGTMYFGTRTDEATSFALLDRFVEAGGRVLDTANCYSFWTSPTGHGGQSEARARPLAGGEPRAARRAGDRDQGRGRADVDGGGVEGLSAAVIEREAARSLGAARCRRDRPLLGARRGPLGHRPRGDGGRVRRAGRRGRRTPARRLQPPRPGGSSRLARSPRRLGRRAVHRAPADDVVRRAAAGAPGAGQGPPLRLRQRRDRRLPRRAPGPRALGLQPAGAGQLRPRGPAVPRRRTTTRARPRGSPRSTSVARRRAASAPRRSCWPGCWRRAGSRSSASAPSSSWTPRSRRPRWSSRRRSSRRSTRRGRGTSSAQGRSALERNRWNRARRPTQARDMTQTPNPRRPVRGRPPAAPADHRARPGGRRRDRQPALRGAAAALRRGPAARHRALHQLARRLRHAPASRSTTRCG